MGTDLVSGRLSAVEDQLEGYLGGWRTGHLEDLSITGGLLVGHQCGGQTRKRVFSDDVVAGCDEQNTIDGYRYHREAHSHSTDICQPPGRALSECHNTTLTTT